MANTKYGKIVDGLLTEMFARVGLTYTAEYVSQDEWYLSKTWTASEQAAFYEWAVKYVKKVFRGCTIEWARKEVGWFLLNYGWKAEDVDEVPKA